jgi:hypothetical protein
VVLALMGVLFLILTGMRPAFDAYGWLVWGHQALRLNLDTNSAPSWKPLTFLFTFPYALTGSAALWLWMETAVTTALAAGVFAARITYRLVSASTDRRYAAIVAAAVAAMGVLGLVSYGHFVLIADSDPMIVTLCLAAIDFELSGRPRLSWTMLILAALGRPEAWVIAVLVAIWSWRARPTLRRWIAAGMVLVPVAWFAIPAVTSPSWMISGDIAKSSSAQVVGNRVSATLNNFLSLYELPVQLVVLLGAAVAVVDRARTWLVLIGLSVLWVALEIAFVLHGWPPSPRYMFEPAAVLVVLAAAGIGRMLGSISPRHVVRWAGLAVLVALVVTMVPNYRIRARLFHNGVGLGQTWARQIGRLHDVIAREGQARIAACGQVVTNVSFQSILAWEMDQNVASVGWKPIAGIRLGKPIVWFEPYHAGWKVIPLHTTRPGCPALRTQTTTG